MRLPLSKTWRAFPELDRFSDEQCMRFVRAGRKRMRRSREAITLGIIMVVSFWVLMPVGAYLAELVPERWDARHPMLATVIMSGAMAVGAIPGAIAILFGWDRVLLKGIRRHLEDTRCDECRYPLLGLPIRDGRVVCPECGAEFVLADHGMTAEDLIAPGN